MLHQCHAPSCLSCRCPSITAMGGQWFFSQMPALHTGSLLKCRHYSCGGHDTGIVDCHLCFQCHLGVYPHTSREAGESYIAAFLILAPTSTGINNHKVYINIVVITHLIYLSTWCLFYFKFFNMIQSDAYVVLCLSVVPSVLSLSQATVCRMGVQYLGHRLH